MELFLMIRYYRQYLASSCLYIRFEYKDEQRFIWMSSLVQNGRLSLGSPDTVITYLFILVYETRECRSQLRLQIIHIYDEALPILKLLNSTILVLVPEISPVDFADLTIMTTPPPIANWKMNDNDDTTTVIDAMGNYDGTANKILLG